MVIYLLRFSSIQWECEWEEGYKKDSCEISMGNFGDNFSDSDKKSGVQILLNPTEKWSGRLDLNQRSSDPQSDALTKLGHAPM